MYEDDYLDAAYEDRYGYDYDDVEDEYDTYDDYDEFDDELDPDYDVFLPDPYDVTDGLDVPSYAL